MKHFPRYWPLVNSPHKGHWRGALVFSFVCAWINGWVNNLETGDLRPHDAHYYVIVMVARYDIIFFMPCGIRPLGGSEWERGVNFKEHIYQRYVLRASGMQQRTMSRNAIIIRSGRFTDLIIASVYYRVGAVLLKSICHKRILGIAPKLNNHRFQAGSILQTAFLLRHHQFCGLLEDELPTFLTICSKVAISLIEVKHNINVRMPQVMCKMYDKKWNNKPH